MIGEQISPVLKEIEDTLWEFEANIGLPPEYTKEGFQAAIKIFMSTLMDKMWALQEEEDMELSTRKAMATKAGEEIKNIVKKYTNIDTTKFYEAE